MADLLRDGHDPSHVAEIAGEVLRRDLASRQEMAAALEPLARRNGQRNGAALLEYLLDLVGLSGEALVTGLASSELGKALFTAGRLSAVRSFIDSVSELDTSTSSLMSPVGRGDRALHTRRRTPRLPEDIVVPPRVV